MAVSCPDGCEWAVTAVLCGGGEGRGCRSHGPPSDLSFLHHSLLPDHEVPQELLCVSHFGSVPPVRCA